MSSAYIRPGAAARNGIFDLAYKVYDFPTRNCLRKNYNKRSNVERIDIARVEDVITQHDILFKCDL